MSKSREHVVTNGKAAFYACIWDDLRQAAMNCGWALGLHGSLTNDMDIMAMQWTEDASPVEEMIQALSDCFTESPFKEHHTIPHYDKPHGRVVYTMSIWADFHLDISIMPKPLLNAQGSDTTGLNSNLEPLVTNSISNSLPVTPVTEDELKTFTTDEVWEMYAKDPNYATKSYSQFAKENGWKMIKETNIINKPLK